MYKSSVFTTYLVVQPVGIPDNPLEGLPVQPIFRPEPPPRIPVQEGERSQLTISFFLHLSHLDSKF